MFNRVPEKVPKVLEKVWEANSGEGLGGFGAEPGQVQQGSLRRSQRRSGRLWCRAGESLGGFGPKPGRERSGEGVAGFSAEPGQAQPGEGSREGSIGAEPGQVQPGFGEGSEKVPRKSGKLAEKVPEKFVFPLFVFVHVHASERSVKINVAAVGGTTEAYFWLFSFARKVS
jgi:hypothetical protein